MEKIETKYDESQIQVLEGLEAVRKRPGMYIGSTSSAGLHHLVYEIVDNSIDEALAGYCTEIKVDINPDNSVVVDDNGRGIPVGIHPQEGIPTVQVVLTILHAGGKFGGGGYKVSGGLHGVGSSVVNALSEKLEVEVSDGKHIHYQSYERGKPTCDLKVIGDTNKTGTKITFKPDPEIFETLEFDYDVLLKRLREQAFLNKGVKILFTDKRTEKPETVVLYAEGGIKEFVSYINKNKDPLHDDIIYFEASRNDMMVEVAMQYTDAYSEAILSFANNIHTIDGGMHETGFKAGLTRVINDYARKYNLLKEKEDNLSGEDTREGLTAVISVKVSEAQFEGQTKTKLDNPDAQKVTSDITGEELERYFDKNLENLKATIACAEKSAKIRKAQEKTKTNMLSKTKFVMEGNGKLANCESRNPEECEVFIVEGDSAGGSAKTARNRRTQAILPIRGKILNVEKASIDKVLANAEIKTMIQAFGCGFSEGYGNDFDISKLRYNKIIIMTDADVDGAHIATLLLTFFYRFMPELIQAGPVYLATPPLYKAIPKKGEEEYLYDDFALEKYRNTHKNDFILQRYKGLGEMDAEQLWETTLDPEHRVLKKVEIDDARLASEVTEMLMGNDVAPRKQFIHDNAYLAELDV